jgi:hypothetical protein
VLSVACAEEEKVFGIAFRTPHDGDVGVAHILEHSVLCGSERYPVKEPFVHLLKSSLQVRRAVGCSRVVVLLQGVRYAVLHSRAVCYEVTSHRARTSLGRSCRRTLTR